MVAGRSLLNRTQETALSCCFSHLSYFRSVQICVGGKRWQLAGISIVAVLAGEAGALWLNMGLVLSTL
jgi:hypothetical protein